MGRGEKIHAHELLALPCGVLLLGPGSERERWKEGDMGFAVK